jgi:hypothetical protein
MVRTWSSELIYIEMNLMMASRENKTRHISDDTTEEDHAILSAVLFMEVLTMFILALLLQGPISET